MSVFLHEKNSQLMWCVVHLVAWLRTHTHRWYDGGADDGDGNDSHEVLKGSKGSLDISTSEDNNIDSTPLDEVQGSYKPLSDSSPKPRTPSPVPSSQASPLITSTDNHTADEAVPPQPDSTPGDSNDNTGGSSPQPEVNK